MEKQLIRIVLDAKDDVGNAFVITSRIIKETAATYTLRENSVLRTEDDDQFDYKLRKSEYLFNKIVYSNSSSTEDYPTSATYVGIIENESINIATLIEVVIAEMKQGLIERFEDHIKMIQSRLEVIKN